MQNADTLKHIVAGDLEVAYHEHGARDHPAVILLHGFPYDVHAYDAVITPLTDAGLRVIVPYLRGYGPTRFLSENTLRSGEQAVLGNDLLALMDALGIDSAILGGYDWGGRAACVVAAVWPERASGLVSCGGYNIQNIARSTQPTTPTHEHRYWYQYYFHSERGRLGLAQNRDELCRLLWSLWSPKWAFTDEEFARSARSLHNDDFVDVVIHSYRHRFGLVEGDQTVASVEARLAEQPDITVPVIAMYGTDNGVMPLDRSNNDAVHFTHHIGDRILTDIGHNIPQEAPSEFANAVLQLSQLSQ